MRALAWCSGDPGAELMAAGTAWDVERPTATPLAMVSSSAPENTNKIP
jgi:hypothetical protein